MAIYYWQKHNKETGALTKLYGSRDQKFLPKNQPRDTEAELKSKGLPLPGSQTIRKNWATCVHWWDDNRNREGEDEEKDQAQPGEQPAPAGDSGR